MACAIQPTVRPRIKIARAVPCGNPNAVVATASAKSTFGGCRSAAMPPPGQRREGARDDRIGCGASRGDTARDKSRGVELVVGEQNKAAADQIGAPLVEMPQRGELLMYRIGRGRPVADT